MREEADPPTGAQTEITVVVPTYQRRDSVVELLRCLERQTLDPDRFEVVVSIDGSDDGTRQALEALGPPYRLRMLWQENRGLAAARNAGIRAARGHLVVLLDDDMRPRPACLEEHRRAHLGGGRLAVMGSAPIRRDPGDGPLVGYMADKFDAHLRTLAEPDHHFVARDVYMGNLSAPRSLLLGAGLFDESFREYGNEDLEMAVRLRAAGAEMVFSGGAVADQTYDKAFATLAAHTVAKGRTAVAFAAKHPTVTDELQLAHFRTGSWRWRLARNALLAATGAVPGLVGVVTAMVERAERRASRRLPGLYAFALDYCFWVGVRQARKAGSRPGRRSTDPANASARLADWRFILGGHPSARVIHDGGPAVATALSDSFTDVTALSTEAPPGPYDIAVLRNPSATALHRVGRALAPGGLCWVERHRPLPGGRRLVERRLRRAGLRPIEAYWFWPPAGGPAAFWLPLHAPEAIRHFLRTRTRPTCALAGAGASAAVAAWRLGRRLGVLAPVGVVARSGDQGAGRPVLSEQLRDHWTAWTGEPAPTTTACLLLTGGASPLNKVVCLAFAGGEAEPRLAVKLARNAASETGIRNEAAALAAVGAHVGPAAVVPRLVFQTRLAGTEAVGESVVEGVPLVEGLGARTFRPLVTEVAEVLASLAAGCPVAPFEAWEPRLVAPVLEAFEDRFAPGVDAAACAGTRRALAALPPLPIVPEHRDCSPWNLLRVADGRLAFVDWESAEPRGLPVMDLVYFLVNAAFLAEGTLGSGGEIETYRRLVTPGSDLHETFAEVTAAYAARLGLDASVLRPLRLLAWMLHATVEHDRIESRRSASPSGGPRGGSVYLDLWRVDAGELL